MSVVESKSETEKGFANLRFVGKGFLNIRFVYISFQYLKSQINKIRREYAVHSRAMRAPSYYPTPSWTAYVAHLTK